MFGEHPGRLIGANAHKDVDQDSSGPSFVERI